MLALGQRQKEHHKVEARWAYVEKTYQRKSHTTTVRIEKARLDYSALFTSYQ